MTPSSGRCILERANRALGQALGVLRLRGVVALCFARHHREQRNRRNAQFEQFSASRNSSSMLTRVDARHRGDRLALVGAFQHEHRIDEIVGGKRVSRISRRENSSRRMRRMRMPGNRPRPVSIEDTSNSLKFGDYPNHSVWRAVIAAASFRLLPGVRRRRRIIISPGVLPKTNPSSAKPGHRPIRLRSVACGASFSSLFNRLLVYPDWVRIHSMRLARI